MRVRMKFVVPLTMPMTRRMRSPASDSRSGRMSGMPPATDASNKQVDAGVLRSFEELRAEVGEELLVRGDDGLRRLQCREHQTPRGLDAADRLDDHVDVRIGDHATRRHW